MQNRILTICIASYNHSEKLYKQIVEILANTDERVGVAVSDNCSSDRTHELLSKIQDERFKFHSFDKNEGPVKNYMKALDLATSKYLLFLTDKDSIKTQKIKEFVDKIARLDFAVGYVELNSKSKKFGIQNFNTKIKEFENIAYLSKHPSGYIYNNEMLKKLKIMDNFVDNDLVGVFPFEFLCAELALKGNVIIIDFELIETAKVAENKNGETSMTYSEANNNLFFTPDSRFDLLEKYLNHLKTLNFKDSDYSNLVQKIVKKAWVDAIYEYRYIIGNEDLCKHYKMPHRILSHNELRNIHDNLINKLKLTHTLSNEKLKNKCISNLNFEFTKRTFLEKLKGKK